MALAYLLAQPQCELLGITTVGPQPEMRARLAEALCQTAGISLPVYPGRSSPLLVTPRSAETSLAFNLESAEVPPSSMRGRAIPFLLDTIRSHPGEVTLLCLGPLTNLAALFAADEEAPSLLKALVTRCGVYDYSSAEVDTLDNNALWDPFAAAMIYQTSFRQHRSVGLEAAGRLVLPAHETRLLFQSPRLRPVLELAEVWFRQRPMVTFEDTLAAALVFQPELCEFERGQVQVELDSERLAGLTSLAARLAGTSRAGAAGRTAFLFPALLLYPRIRVNQNAGEQSRVLGACETAFLVAANGDFPYNMTNVMQNI